MFFGNIFFINYEDIQLIGATKEDWSIVTKFVTPGNVRTYGNPDFEDIAACLGEGVLDHYRDETAEERNANTKV